MARKRIEERRLTEEVVASIDDEIERVTALLSTVIKVANITKRELEKELGASGGYLSRLLSGKMGLSVRHILLICAAIGMEPAEFFHLAYPEAPGAGEGSGMARDILRRFQGLGYEGKGNWSPGRGPATHPANPGAALSDEDLDERIRASLGRALRELVTGDLPLSEGQGVAPKRSTRGRKA
ncbi:MAG TPA: helix-turn-helix transcriptional regulator [Thermoanaerobaculia bacterium]|nr:helix-turn-helix transcriptional regulator [Thermoanaerobaculia bacterium]